MVKRGLLFRRKRKTLRLLNLCQSFVFHRRRHGRNNPCLQVSYISCDFFLKRVVFLRGVNFLSPDIFSRFHRFFPAHHLSRPRGNRFQHFRTVIKGSVTLNRREGCLCRGLHRNRVVDHLAEDGRRRDLHSRYLVFQGAIQHTVSPHTAQDFFFNVLTGKNSLAAGNQANQIFRLFQKQFNVLLTKFRILLKNAGHAPHLFQTLRRPSSLARRNDLYPLILIRAMIPFVAVAMSRGKGIANLRNLSTHLCQNILVNTCFLLRKSLTIFMNGAWGSRNMKMGIALLEMNSRLDNQTFINITFLNDFL